MPSPSSSIAVIGAGIAGLSCARVLHAAGHPVTLFDKARGPGGRLSSRRAPGAIVDLGAQYFTARDPLFQAQLSVWRRDGLIQLWPTSLWRVDGRDWQPHRDEHPRYCPMPRMSALTRHLAAGLILQTERRIIGLERRSEGWYLDDQQQRCHGPFERVAISTPAPQAEALVAAHDEGLVEACHSVEQLPCWAGYALFDSPLPELPGVDRGWQAAFINTGPLRFVARNQFKPGRGEQGESLTLLATAEWSQAWLEQPTERVADALYAALRELLPASVQPAVHGCWQHTAGAMPNRLVAQRVPVSASARMALHCVGTAGWVRGSKTPGVPVSASRKIGCRYVIITAPAAPASVNTAHLAVGRWSG